MGTISRSATIIFLLSCLLFPAPAPGIEDWFTTGLSSLKAGQYADALSAFNKALENDPGQANAYNGRGAVWYKLEAYDRAIADYTKALEINPTYANAYNNRGVAWYQIGNYDRAIEDYDQALSINSNYVNALNNRGAAWKKRGEYENAIADFKAALLIRPSYEALNLLAWTLATCPEEKFRNGPLAVELAEKAVAIRMEVPSMSTLAAAFAEAGLFNDAVVTQKQVIAMLQKEGQEKKMASHIARLEAYEAGEVPLEKPVAFRETIENQKPADTGKIVEKDLVADTGEGKVARLASPVTAVQKPTAGKAPSALPFTIQVSSYRNRQIAFREALKLRQKGVLAFNAHAYVASKGGDWFRIFVGVYKTAEEAEKEIEEMDRRKLRHSRVVKMPWAVQVELLAQYPPIDEMEKMLRGKKYLPYRLPVHSGGTTNRLLVGAYASEAEAVEQVDRLRMDDFSSRAVRR